MLCPYKKFFDCSKQCSKMNFLEGIDDEGIECEAKETLIEMAKECPECKKGIINPTENLTLTCDKCPFERHIFIAEELL